MNPYYYDYDYGYAGDAAMTGMITFMLIYYLLMFAWAVVNYVFTSLSFYTIAKRRRISNAWMAWVPVCNSWILGSISDQYQYMVKSRVRNRRKLLLGLSIGVFGAAIVLLPLTIVMVSFGVYNADAAIVLAMLVMLLCFAIMALAIVLAVFQYIALYDLFVSCKPENAVLFLVLSIIFGVVLPFFLFACRNKDEGMRRPVYPPYQNYIR